MREIKLRVWGEREKEMFYPGNKMLTFYNENKRINYRDVFSHFKHRYKKMLYTNLKDKNGKEIYGGDIIEGKGGRKYLIKFDDNMAQFVKKKLNKVFNVGGNSIGTETNLRGIDSYKIIGNKYENPELVE